MLYIQYFRYALYAVFLVHKVLGCSSALSLTGRCNRLAPPLCVMLSIEHLVVPNSPVSLWTFYLTCFLSLSLANCSIFPMGLNNMSWSVSLILKQSKVLRSDWLETGVFWCVFFFFLRNCTSNEKILIEKGLMKMTMQVVVNDLRKLSRFGISLCCQ